jgi:hypothetical protein
MAKRLNKTEISDEYPEERLGESLAGERKSRGQVRIGKHGSSQCQGILR